ncbi:MAG: aldehyde ferredoxin oxidoreductase family protein [Candidatus Bathyarchaeota archaeon]|nr:aldehyde ferredoxin oxidoreductase family protein [Candidatus Bathyarchaeota archaeon]
MIGGVCGRILMVDLSSGRSSVEQLDESWISRFIGGAGYATKFLLNYTAVERSSIPDPLSPDNPLIVMTGPLTGVSAFGSKTVLVSRSPLTYGLGKSTFAGSFGLSLKKAGFDGIVVVGASDKPVHIIIDDGSVDVKPASDLWGMDSLEASSAIARFLGDGFRSIVIGLAGERLSRIACIVSSERRIAGRTGLGAVMGSKKLKAISVRGSNPIDVHDPECLRKLNSNWLSKAPRTSRGEAMMEYGTAGGVSMFIRTGNLPIKHWVMGSWDDAWKISGVTIMEKYRSGSGRKICGSGILCSIACERVVEFDEPGFGRYKGKGPEYESVAALGSMVLNSDPIVLIKLNELCDRLGIDTISTGEVIAWAMEAYEKGLITKDDTGGLELRWGDASILSKLVEMIGLREGFGTILSDGVKRASEAIGRGTDRFALHVKGLEVPYHNPRLYKSMGLAYATSNRGACHLQGMAMLVERGVLLPEYGISKPPSSVEEYVNTVIIHQNLCCFLDSAILCKFGVFGIVDFDHIAKVWTAVTGIGCDKMGILHAGESVWYLERMVNYLFGMSNSDDNLPRRFVEEPIADGPAKGSVCDNIHEMLNLFYECRSLRSIEELKSKLHMLGLEDIAPLAGRIKLN